MTNIFKFPQESDKNDQYSSDIKKPFFFKKITCFIRELLMNSIKLLAFIQSFFISPKSPIPTTTGSWGLNSWH